MNPIFPARCISLCLARVLCLLATIAALTASSHAQAADGDAVSLGPFSPSPALTIYLVNDGTATPVHLTLRRGAAVAGDRILLRAFDADEKNTRWQYIESGKMPDSFVPTQRATWGIPALTAPVVEAKKAGDIVWEGDVALRGTGVNQIRITAGNANTSLELRLPRALSWGVSFQNGEFKSWPDQPATLFSLVPPHAEELEIAGGPMRVSDENGAPIFAADKTAATSQKVSVSQTNVLWKWEFAPRTDWRFRAAGFPLILCPDEKSARAIGASVETLPDGTVVAHKFQRRIAELLPRLLDPKNVGRAEDLIVPLASREKEWLSDPVRNANLLDAYGLMPSVEWALRHQNVDPTSHWSGSLDGWQRYEKMAPPLNRWDRWKTISVGDEPVRDNNMETGGLWAGASSNTGATAENLALAVSLDAPFNPYFAKRELLYRAAAAALRDLMALGEDETWRGVGSDMSNYPGFMAFAVAQKTLPVYALVAPQMPADVREVWTEGVEHILDRLYPESLVTARNQSSHFLVAYQDLARGSGLPRHQEMARLYARHWLEGQHPAGFQIEKAGPDASYIGMTHWHEAVYFRESGDKTILESLRRSYRFFNHTVAPEPDGQMLGGFNFNHRVGQGFDNEQWGGARGILDDVLPEVGLWAKPRSIGTRERSVAAIQAALKQLPEPKMPDNITNPRYFYASKADTTGVWPALEPGDYVRDLGGELVAFKRAGYFGAVYVGHPAPVDYYIADREQFRLPAPGDAENKGGAANIRKVTPFLGGGLSLFWTPNYGSSVLATNWSPLAHHGLVALQADGKRYWEDYFATKYAVDEKAGTLRVEGRIENQPISYVRTYSFEADGVRVRVQLKADKDIALAGLWENLPFATGTAKTRGAELVVPGEKDGAAQAERFTIRDKNGAGVEVVFDAAQQLRVQRNGLQNNGLQIARVEVALPAQWTSGQTVTLGYQLRPLP